jgi:small subunit ribosomal protein S23
MKHLRERKPRVEAVVYEEDRIRRRFFADFPFEALRPTSLVEGREVRMEDEEGVSGENWKRLDQRGSYATVEK